MALVRVEISREGGRWVVAVESNATTVSGSGASLREATEVVMDEGAMGAMNDLQGARNLPGLFRDVGAFMDALCEAWQSARGASS